MLKTGCIILSAWAALGLLPALYFALSIAFFGGMSPALTALSPEDLSTLSPQALRAANSIAVFANGTHVAFSSLILIALWKGLYKQITWVFWALLISIPIAVMSGAVGNYMADTLFPEADILSAFIFTTGIACCSIALFRPVE